MTRDRLELTSSCSFQAVSWADGAYPTDVTLEYTEHSSDHYHSDHETSIDLNKEDAIRIVKFLTRHFGLDKP